MRLGLGFVWVVARLLLVGSSGTLTSLTADLVGGNGLCFGNVSIDVNGCSSNMVVGVT